MISAFGPAAERYARGLGGIDAVVTDYDRIVPAYLEALRRRERGEAFYGMILGDDSRVALAYAAAPSLLDQVSDVDKRMQTFAMLAQGTVQSGGRPLSQIWADPPEHFLSAEFYRLAGAMLVRSYAEFARFAERSGGFAPPVERVLVEPRLPPIERRVPDRPAIVIWGPQRPAAHLALHAFGTSEFLGEVWCVAADVASAPRGANVLTAGDPRTPDVLARAGCVVCVEPNDPGDAVAFARRGFGVVAAATSGAHEFVPDAVVWDAADATTLHGAVAKALARPAIRLASYVPPAPAPARPPAPLPRERLPLVSVIIPTYNRPRDLRSALLAVAAQTYPRVEAIVVNDCGVAVDDVVAEFPFATLIDHAVNRGAVGAVETGLARAEGEYIVLLPDDDSLYPDHVERIVFALLRSGAQIAHSSGMLRYVERADDGGWKTTGLNGTTFSDTLTPTSALIATPVSLNSVIQHRTVFENGGWFADSCLSDLELHMRQAQRYVFVHVDAITFEFREHAGNAAKQADFATELRRIYDHVHPLADRPLVGEYRAATHARIAARVPGRPAFPPTIPLP